LRGSVIVLPTTEPTPPATPAEGLSIDNSGNLKISLRTGTLLFKKPQAYQETSRGRQSVESVFRINLDHSVQFALGPYDRKQELVVDPVFVFSTYLAGSNGDWPIAITSDSAGNVYVTGYTDSTDFPIENGIQPTISGSPDAFVQTGSDGA
jgi:beta-propeller repeat-containing protein